MRSYAAERKREVLGWSSRAGPVTLTPCRILPASYTGTSAKASRSGTYARRVPLRAAALQFALAHPAVEIVMLGARTPHEWQDAQAMLRQPIDPAFWHALRGAGLLPPAAPTP